MSGCIRTVLDLEHDDVPQATVIPVGSCQERTAQPIPIGTLILYGGGQLVLVTDEHDVSALICVGEENCCGGFRGLSSFIRQREDWTCGVEPRTLHVGGEENRLLPLRDELPDSTVDCGLLRVSSFDLHGLVHEGEYHVLSKTDLPSPKRPRR